MVLENLAKTSIAADELLLKFLRDLEKSQRNYVLFFNSDQEMTKAETLLRSYSFEYRNVVNLRNGSTMNFRLKPDTSTLSMKLTFHISHPYPFSSDAHKKWFERGKLKNTIVKYLYDRPDEFYDAVKNYAEREVMVFPTLSKDNEYKAILCRLVYRGTLVSPKQSKKFFKL